MLPDLAHIVSLVEFIYDTKSYIQGQIVVKTVAATSIAHAERVCYLI